MSGARATRVALACGLVSLVLVSLVFLSGRAPRRSGTNLTGDTGFVIPLGAGQRLCEAELVPGDTGALDLNASPRGAPGPELEASVVAPGATIASGRLAGGWREGHIRIPLSRVAKTTGATVCLRNRGSHAVAFGGSIPASGFQIQLAGGTLNGRLRIEYLRPGRESWLELAPTLAYRFSLAKSGLVRHWAVWAVPALMALAIGLAVGTLAREGRGA